MSKVSYEAGGKPVPSSTALVLCALHYWICLTKGSLKEHRVWYWAEPHMVNQSNVNFLLFVLFAYNLFYGVVDACELMLHIMPS